MAAHARLATVTVPVLLCLCCLPASGQSTRPAATQAEKIEAGERARRAVELYTRGDYARVVEIILPAHRLGAASIQERIILARALGRLDRPPGEAIDVLKDVLRTDAENPEANNLLGQSLHRIGRHKEAAEYLARACKLKADAATAGLLGQSFYALGDLAKAKEYLEKAIAQDVLNPVNSLLLGRICLARGAGSAAERYLLLAQDAGIDTPELHLLLGKAYMLQRKFVGPVVVRRLDGDHSPGQLVGEHVVLGKLAPGQYRLATRYCALYEGLRLASPVADGAADMPLGPDTAEPLHMLVVAWQAAGQPKLAARWLAALEQAEGSTARVRRLKAAGQLANGDFAGLDRTLSDAAKSNVLDAATVSRLYYQSAMSLRSAGRRDEAAAMLRQAEAATPTNASVLRALAHLAESAGRTAEAADYYARIIELYPDAGDIDELRNALRKNRRGDTGMR